MSGGSDARKLFEFMDFIADFFGDGSIGYTLVLYSFIIATGVLLGKIKVGGISLGVTFVLFVGIAVGHFGGNVNPDVLNFLKEFGLILFIYSIGLQVGPSFFSSFKKGGMWLNFLALCLVLLGVGTTIAAFYIWNGRLEMPMLVGIMSGAVTNTPGLGAAQEALRTSGYAGSNIGLGYAVAYPMGVLGVILTLLLLRWIMRVKLDDERKEYEERSVDHSEEPHKLTIEVANRALEGKTILQCKRLVGRNFVISRMSRRDDYIVPRADTILHNGDKLLVVCADADAEAIKIFIGEEIHDFQWQDDESKMVSRRIVITQNNINGRTLGSLHLGSAYGVNVTRINRSSIDIVASPNLVLQVGDRLTVIGPKHAIKSVEAKLGNTLRRLNEPHMASIFFGILAGIIVGTIPIYFPGMPMPAKLGLAGGPLIVAILIGRFGYKVKLITYTTQSANLMLREMGICLFLASVGLSAGGEFVETVVSPNGLLWVLVGCLITIIPTLVIAFVARIAFKLNYFTIMGLIAGSCTNPPILAYSSNVADNNAPAVAYSTVYPMSMFLRIIVAQVLILAFI